jgi:pantoate--beta-alanine ligase
MAKDLFLPVTIVGVPTVREDDGLAMSSRNRYLSPEARATARAIPTALHRAHSLFVSGERDAAKILEAARAELGDMDSIDYVSLADPDSVALAPSDAPLGYRALLALAVRLGGARLIDNVVLGEDPSPLAGRS